MAKESELEVFQTTLADGEILEIISDEKFRGLDLNNQAAILVKVKQLADFFHKRFKEWEPIVRTKMDQARTDSTEINQVVVDGAKVHLGAGKVDQELGVYEIEKFWDEMQRVNPSKAKLCFKEIHKPVKSEITKLRKQKGEPGSEERKISDMIERYYNPQPKKLEIKEA